MTVEDQLQGKLTELTRTLLLYRYGVDTVKRVSPECALLGVHRSDDFGGRTNYLLLLSTGLPTESTLSLMEKTARARQARPVVLSEESPGGGFTWYRPADFYQILGGPATTGLVLLPDLPDILEALGRNQVPVGLSGNADDLYEDYVKQCLQFLLNSPAWRYGQDRLFEKVPDGLIFGRDNFLLQFDAKAYGKGFTVGADDVRRFATYVNDFNSKYGAAFGRVHSFLVVSTEFTQGEAALVAKSKEMYAACQTRLSFLRSRELGLIVWLMRDNVSLRNSVNWRLVFSDDVISKAAVESQLRAARKDGLL